MVNKVVGIALLGSTGSIGRQTLDIIRSFNTRFRIIGLACRKDSELFKQQVNEFKPEYICVEIGRQSQDSSLYCTLEEMASLPGVDLIVIATTGKAGLRPALAALKAGKKVALANKEILVMAGPLITTLASEYGATILPIDSEHCAVWQCLQGENRTDIQDIADSVRRAFHRLVSGQAGKGYSFRCAQTPHLEDGAKR